MNVLAVVAHPDDEVIGVGGTLIKHTTNGDVVHVLILGDGKTSRQDHYHEMTEASACLKSQTTRRLDLPDNRFDSVTFLDIVKRIEKVIQEIKPDIIYTHFSGDINIDHQITAKATMTASRLIPKQNIKAVFSFETLSSTEWNYLTSFRPNYFVDISKQLQFKLDAMREYKSELREFPHPRSLKAIENNALTWGAKSGMFAAEPFVLLRGKDLF